MTRPIYLTCSILNFPIYLQVVKFIMQMVISYGGGNNDME